MRMEQHQSNKEILFFINEKEEIIAIAVEQDAVILESYYNPKLEQEIRLAIRNNKYCDDLVLGYSEKDFQEYLLCDFFKR